MTSKADLSDDKQSKKKDLTLKIVVMGNKYVGKTSLLNRYVHGGFHSHYNYTRGGDIYYKTVKADSKLVKLILIDTAGQVDQKSIVQSLYRDAHGIMIVFDLTNERSFKDVDGWIYQIRSHTRENAPQLTLVGNKSDLCTSHRHIKENSVEKKATQHGLKYSLMSARMDINITEGFELLIREILKNRSFNKVHPSDVSDSIRLVDDPPKHRTSCSC